MEYLTSAPRTSRALVLVLSRGATLFGEIVEYTAQYQLSKSVGLGKIDPISSCYINVIFTKALFFYWKIVSDNKESLGCINPKERVEIFLDLDRSWRSFISHSAFGS